MSASRRIVKFLRSISADITLLPSAFNYDEVIGKIWTQEQGAYDTVPGKIFLSDPSAAVTPQWGGSYDKRV